MASMQPAEAGETIQRLKAGPLITEAILAIIFFQTNN
jgi:hypothetical protein